MAHVITLRDLHPLDILVLRDLVRFGVLADDQIQRRYGHTAISTDRLALLESGGFINKPRANVIQGCVIYTATRYGTVITRCGLSWRLTNLKGWAIATTLSTPGATWSASISCLRPLPTAATIVRSVPRVTWGW